jgi:CheY-like chemotaxis protein
MSSEGSGLSVDTAHLVSSLFALLPIPLAVVDQQNRIVLSNSTFSEIFPDITELADTQLHEIVCPGRGIFELEILPLTDHGYRIVYGLDVSKEVSLRRQLTHLERRSERRAHRRSVACDLNELTRSAAAQREPHMRAARAALSFDLKSQLPRIAGDPDEIERVLLGLIVNAEKSIVFAQRQFGAIHIRTWTENGQVRLSISDNGCGISSGYIFSAGLENGSKDGKPQAISLESCAEIIKDHGGELFCWSGYDVGSTYTVEMPSMSAAVEKRSLTTPTDGRRLSNRAILVIADDVHVSEMIFDVLTRHGASVDLAESYSGAEPMLKSRRYDLIICDQNIPGLSGDRFRMNVESIVPGVFHRFLFVTADSVTAHTRSFFAQSGVDFIRRPFHVNDLMATVEQLLSQKPQQDS